MLLVLLSFFLISVHRDVKLISLKIQDGEKETKADPVEDKVNFRNDELNEHGNDKKEDVVDPFDIQPECSILKELTRRGTRSSSPKDLSLDKIFAAYGKYVSVPNPHPRYDHRSCFFMRPNYNCARNTKNETYTDSTVATDFALVLQQPN